eukprot:TRINITY_DN2398_c0_g1_i8.p1 TRINITY_DN2398_c0_g1~~TRINITY_DN2398_c0_g1_i8.p1  ORF type:complete len:570 (-),score=65.58 TRINITY_DN2398_c0_g1_i8:623-2332(-)
MGSCGYGYICQDEGTGWDVAAISNKHWDYENSCGRCYEVKCRSGTFTDGFGEQIQRENVCRNESSSVLVRVVDTCPCTGENYSNTRWCCGDMEHLGLSVWAFEKLSDIKYGVIGIEYRQVACDYVLDSAALPVKAPFKPEYEDLKNDCQKAQTYQNKNVVANSLNITHTSLPNQQLYQQNEDELWSLLFNTNFQVHQEDLKQSEVVISTRNSALVQNQTIFNSSTDQQDWWVTSSKASIEQRKGLGQQGGTIICSSIQPGGNLAFTGVPGALYGQKFLELWLKELEDEMLTCPNCRKGLPLKQLLSRNVRQPSIQRQLVQVVCGRRAAKIATRKGKQDALKGKLYSKIGKLIIQAVRRNGPDPQANVRLSELINMAQAASVPKEIVERNIKRASDVNQADMNSLLLEAYGPGGSGWVIECLTDSDKRSKIEVWQVVRKVDGKMADGGSVLFNFKQEAHIVLNGEGLTEDAVFEAALAAGGDDILPISDEEDQLVGYKVVCPVEEFGSVRDSLVEQGLNVSLQDSGLVYTPLAKVELDDESFELCDGMFEKLLEIPDVDAVYTTAEGIGL